MFKKDLDGERRRTCGLKANLSHGVRANHQTAGISRNAFASAVRPPRSVVCIARGRPVGLAIDRTGALLVADDMGGIVWRVLY